MANVNSSIKLVCVQQIDLLDRKRLLLPFLHLYHISLRTSVSKPFKQAEM